MSNTKYTDEFLAKVRATRIDRSNMYEKEEGHKCLETIAKMWMLQIQNRCGVDITLTPLDVTLMMISLKQARAWTSPKVSEDSLIDIGGYSDLAYSVMKGSNSRVEDKDLERQKEMAFIKEFLEKDSKGEKESN